MAAGTALRWRRAAPPARAAWAVNGARGAVVALAVAVALPTLVLARLLVRYDILSRGTHASAVRRALPRRLAAWTVPALPLLALTAPALPSASDGAPATAAFGLWVICVLAAAEVYSVCFHREAWIAAFEPWHIPDDARPLGGPAPRHDDLRLHHLVRVQILYAAPAVLAACAAGRGSVVASGATLLFAAKFVAHASSDYEVFYHWHLHCRVLDVVGRPRLSRAVEAVVVWALGPLHGYLPNVYRAEHLLSHHPENGGTGDVHSPLRYSRTSLLEFAVYALDTTASLLTGHRIVRHRRCRPRMRRAVVAGVCAYWAVVLALAASGRLLAVWLVVAAVHRGVTATRSQYVWHAFVDQARPRDPVATTMLWVSVPEGASDAERLAAATTPRPPVPPAGTDWAFFDNHHLIHHLHPRAHYSEYPALLEREVPRLVANGAMVLDLGHLYTFASDCWGGDAERLRTTVVTPSDAEVLRARLAPARACRSPYGAICESAAARRVERPLLRALLALTGGR